MAVISSKYKNIGGLVQDEVLASPTNESHPFHTFEKKYLKPIFTKQEEIEDLDITYSIHEHEEEKKEDTGRRMKLP